MPEVNIPLLMYMKAIRRKAEQVKANPQLATLYMDDIIHMCTTVLVDAGAEVVPNEVSKND